MTITNATNSLKPTLIDNSYGIGFFECPVDGDESPLLVRKDGVFYYSTLYDLPTSAAEAQEEWDYSTGDNADEWEA